MRATSGAPHARAAAEAANRIKEMKSPRLTTITALSAAKPGGVILYLFNPE